jgi:hypothetical protein
MSLTVLVRSGVGQIGLKVLSDLRGDGGSRC